MFSKNFKISNLNLSSKSKTIIIAEIGINHEGNFSKCIKMINEANKAGANLIKLQVVDPNSNYEKSTLSYKLFKNSILSDENIFKIYSYCKKKKINIFSTFDKRKFEFFKKLNQPCYKISSSLFYDYFLIKDILKMNKPVLISTGVSDLEDISKMVSLLKKEKNKKISFLHCRSLYPTNVKKLHLSRIKHISEEYNVLTGYSDHTMGLDVSITAVNMGAKIIEKHFTLDSKRKGFDHKISLEPESFSLMVKKIRENENMIGKPNFKVFSHDNDFKKLSSIIRGYKLTTNVNRNNFLKKTDFSTIRMSNSTKITKFSKIINLILTKKIKKNLKKGKVLSLNDFKKN
jgi:sialic acid synthase SpsE